MEDATQEDVELLCKYRKERLPKVEEQSKALDFEVVKGLFNSLVAQGVKAAEIAQGRTRLANTLCKVTQYFQKA
jgi:hypothetical protein